MRTCIFLDDNLVNKARRYSSAKTNKELINIALLEYIQNHRTMNLAEIRGKISFRRGYDYKKLRGALHNDGDFTNIKKAVPELRIF